MKQMPADLVIVNEKPHSYAQDFQESLETLGPQQPGTPCPRERRPSRTYLSAPRRSDFAEIALNSRSGGSGCALWPAWNAGGASNSLPTSSRAVVSAIPRLSGNQNKKPRCLRQVQTI